jgi:VanZ family protein
MALIFYSSSQSDPAPTLTRVVWDKLLHGGGYAVLGVLFAVALHGEGLALGRIFVLAVLLTSLYAASDEWHQRYTPGRESDVRDWLADTVGGTFGAAGFAAVSMASRRRRPPRR